MYRKSAARGVGEAVDPVIIRSLTLEYQIRAAGADLRKALAFIAAKPEMVGRSLTPVRYEIEQVQAFHRYDPGTGVPVEGSADRITVLLNQHIATKLADECPRGLLLHAASVVLEGRHLIIVGRKMVGKTTLALQLLCEGFGVEGDEHVFIGEHHSIARPRTLRVKESSIRFVPHLCDAIQSAPFIANPLGEAIYSVNPALGGRAWRISPAYPAHFVFLEANHGGHSSIRSIPFNEALRRLIANSILLSSDKVSAVLHLRRHLQAAKAWRLTLGDLRGAVGHLRQLSI
jgi:hypothetical protein